MPGRWRAGDPLAESAALDLRTSVLLARGDIGAAAAKRHLRAVLDEYAAHYNQHRPHQARKLQPPDGDAITMATTTNLTTARIRRRGVLGGLIHEYKQAA